MQLGTKVIVVDKESNYYQKVGKIIAVYDPKQYKSEVCVLFKQQDDIDYEKRIGFRFDQLIDATKAPISSRGDLYRTILNEKNSRKDIVEIIRKLRDLGLIELNLPSN